MSKTAEEILKEHFPNKYINKYFNVSHEICWADIISVMEAYHTAKLEEKDAEISTLKAEIERQVKRVEAMHQINEMNEAEIERLKGDNIEYRGEAERMKIDEPEFQRWLNKNYSYEGHDMYWEKGSKNIYNESIGELMIKYNNLNK